MENGEGVAPETARSLQIIAFAMGSGLMIFAAIVGWLHFRSAGAVPDPGAVHSINTMTTTAMILSLGLIVASEFVWRSLLKAGGSLDARVRTAFIVRLAMREGASFLGLVVALLAARNGVLRVYPAYWVNFVPFGLFAAFLAAHWPTPEKLMAESREVVV